MIFTKNRITCDVHKIITKRGKRWVFCVISLLTLTLTFRYSFASHTDFGRESDYFLELKRNYFYVIGVSKVRFHKSIL